jgi:hypothetical protein
VPFVSQPPLAAPTEHTRNIYILVDIVNQINMRTRVIDQIKRGTHIDMMTVTSDDCCEILSCSLASDSACKDFASSVACFSGLKRKKSCRKKQEEVNPLNNKNKQSENILNNKSDKQKIETLFRRHLFHSFIEVLSISLSFH